jgi:uncharacterized SAM-binding protein YcdF (DUF218 family)
VFTFLYAFLRLCGLLLKALLLAAVLIAALLGTTALIIYSYFGGTAELPADCAIVFGAAVYGQDTASPAITRRVSAAAKLYREDNVQKIILSGGKGTGVRESEAQVMRTVALEQGVLETDIVMEDQSHSTWENILHSRPLAEGCTSVIGVSDQYHLARIELLSWRLGWGNLQTAPAQGKTLSASERRGFIREIFAYLYYLSYMNVFLPDLPARHS